MTTLAAPRTLRLAALSFVPYVLVVALHLGTKVVGWGALDHATKYLLMPALVIPVVLLSRQDRLLPRVLLLLGVLFSWVGDVTLVTFVIGLSFFLLAHLAYTVTFVSAFRRRASRWSLFYLVWFAALLTVLWSSLGAMLVPVAVYGAALAVMAAMATRGNLLTTLGGASFVVSDTLLAFRLFTPALQGVVADIAIMVFYLLAQAMLVLGLLRRSPVA
jgi:uncharacterized membrane protein YhhN